MGKPEELGASGPPEGGTTNPESCLRRCGSGRRPARGDGGGGPMGWAVFITVQVNYLASSAVIISRRGEGVKAPGAHLRKILKIVATD